LLEFLSVGCVITYLRLLMSAAFSSPTKANFSYNGTSSFSHFYHLTLHKTRILILISTKQNPDSLQINYILTRN